MSSRSNRGTATRSNQDGADASDLPPFGLTFATRPSDGPVPPSDRPCSYPPSAMGGTRELVRATARPVAVTAATAAWVLGALANNLSGWSFTITAAAGAVLTALAAGIPLRAAHNPRVRAGRAEQIAE